MAEQGTKLPRAAAVRNKQPAATQITAEQLLRESKSLQADEFQPPSVKITDPEELAGELCAFLFVDGLQDSSFDGLDRWISAMNTYYLNCRISYVEKEGV